MKHSVYLAVTLIVTAVASCSSNTGPGTSAGNKVASIEVAPDTVHLFAGDSVGLIANPLDAQGHVVSGISITFTSPDTAVASVSLVGLVRAVGYGFTNLTVSGGGATGHVPVFVSAETLLGFRPFGAAVSTNGVVYVTQAGSDSVARADLPGHTFTAAVSVGAGPTSVTFASAGGVAYVANQNDYTVGVINVATNMQTTTLTPPGFTATFFVRSDPRGNVLWVTTNADSVFGIDETTGTIVYRFGTGGAANGIAFASANDSLVYVSVPVGTVEETNFKAGTVLRTLAIGGHPEGIAVSPDGRELYIADEGSDSLHVWSLTSGAEVATVVLDGAAFDLELSSDGTKLWVGVIGAGEVQVVNRAARTIANTYKVGGTVRRIALNADGTVAVVANEAGWVDFIR